MIAIRQRVLDDIVDQARAEAPSECCGLLIGSVRMGEPAVEASVRTRNIRKSATRYQVDPAQHFAAIRRARAEGREIIGAYHSHPQSAPIPSPTDVAEATYPDFVYVIVSLLDAGHPEVRAFRIDGGALRRFLSSRSRDAFRRSGDGRATLARRRRETCYYPHHFA